MNKSIAYSLPCILSPKDFRPVVGLIGFNLLYFKKKDIIEFDFYELTQTIIHELFHVLAFNPSLFKMYRLPSNNTQYYSVDQHWIAFPTVVQWARNHFNCSKIDKVPLENNGGQGTVSTHWERSLLWNDLMTSTLKKDDIVWSGINNALLEDTGWYSTDLSYHDELFWGKNKGCSFVYELCHSTTHKFEEFCDKSQLGLTMTGFMFGGVGVCSKGDGFIDKKCSIVTYSSDTQCKNVKNAQSVIGHELSELGSTFGWNSKSFYSTLQPIKQSEEIEEEHKVQCYQSQCEYKDSLAKEIKVFIGNNTNHSLVCSKSQDQLILPGYRGYLSCPNIQDFCNKSNQCKDFCNFGGFCKNRKCVCTPGASGPYCECQNGKFWDDKKCVKCQTLNCQKCNTFNQCLACQTNFILLPNGTCQFSSQLAQQSQKLQLQSQSQKPQPPKTTSLLQYLKNFLN